MFLVLLVIVPQIFAGITKDQNSACKQRCVAAGHCDKDNLSCDQTPSCQMGCNIASVAESITECMQICNEADDPKSGWGKGGCTFKVNKPNGPVLQMCGKCAECSNKKTTGTPTFTKPYECALGCRIAFSPRREAAWSALCRRSQ